jgi:hypothetical protein
MVNLGEDRVSFPQVFLDEVDSFGVKFHGFFEIVG